MDFIEAKLELPLNGGHVFATVAYKEVVHVHATGHASGDGVCHAVDLKAKEGDGEDDIFWSNTSLLHRFIRINLPKKEETLFCFKFCMG